MPDQNLRGMIDRFFGLRWKLVTVIFIAGLCLRAGILFSPHIEGDELIYMTLVEQLENGNGYTLQGSQLLEQGYIDRFQYDHPLFFHPPGGIALFWLFKALFGLWGFPLLQMAAFALFFWSMMLLVESLPGTAPDITRILAALLATGNPIVSHVSRKFWLDGPLLGLVTLAASLYMLAIRRKQWPLAAGAGVVLGLASTVKVTAFMALPGMVVLAWVLLAPPRPALFMRYVLLLLLPAIIIQLPWELWQWRDIGSPFPGWAGKPSASLVASNPYIHFVTVTRSPWIYLTLTPVVLWTFVPDFILLGARWRDRSVRNSGLALLFWLLSIIAVHIALGFLGYSKLLRYVILAVPAGILLFSLLASETITRCRSAGSRLYSLLVAVSLVALVLEISCGVMASFDFGADLIVPLFTGT